MDFKDFLNKALGLVGSKKSMIDLIRTDKKNYQITDLVDKCEKKSKITSTLNTTAPLHKSAIQPPIAQVTVAALGLTVNAGEKKMDEPTEMIRSLAFSVRTLQQNANIGVVEPQPTVNLSARNRNVRQN